MHIRPASAFGGDVEPDSADKIGVLAFHHFGGRGDQSRVDLRQLAIVVGIDRDVSRVTVHVATVLRRARDFAIVRRTAESARDIQFHHRRVASAHLRDLGHHQFDFVEQRFAHMQILWKCILCIMHHEVAQPQMR